MPAWSRSGPHLPVISTVVEGAHRPGKAVRVVGVVKIAPYGTWDSPISAAEVATGHRERRWVQAQPEHVWWTETRPFVQRINDYGDELRGLLPAKRRRRRRLSSDATPGGPAGAD